VGGVSFGILANGWWGGMMLADSIQVSMHDIPLPKIIRHQRFADLVLQGLPAVEAVYQAGYKPGSRTRARETAKELMKRPDVIAYLQACREAARNETLLSIQEKRAFLARIVRTALTEIDASSPAPEHGALLKKWKYKKTERGVEAEMEKLDPLAAIKLDCQLTGEGNAQADAILELTRALAEMNAQSQRGEKMVE
jgi:phage terminase small subunit